MNIYAEETEQELRESEAFATKVLATSINGIYIYDLEQGTNIYLNPQYTQLTGYTLESLNAMTSEEFFSLFHPDDQPQIAAHMQEVTQAGNDDIIRIEYRFKTAAGHWIWCLSWDAVFERDKAGNVKQFVGSFIDITERKQSEEALRKHREHLEELVAERTTELNERIAEVEQLNEEMLDLLQDLQVANQQLEQTSRELEAANQELEGFSYSVSHDLRAPLRAMDGFSRILLEEYAPQLAPEANRYLQRVRDNARQMGQLIDDLLSFSRLNRHPLKKQSVVPANLVRQALDVLSAEREERHVEITIGDLPVCQADPALLKQVFVNLLGNALKYTRKREVAIIEIGCHDEVGQSGRQVYFVRDNGIGFDMRYADKLFGVFQRLHHVGEYEGTGVGLATVQRIIHRHGGRIWGEAEVGKGATFYFTLGGADIR